MFQWVLHTDAYRVAVLDGKHCVMDDTLLFISTHDLKDNYEDLIDEGFALNWHGQLTSLYYFF
jgi:hypothetical protein